MVASAAAVAFFGVPDAVAPVASAASQDRSLDEAVAEWDFTGFNGRLNLTTLDATWFDFAFPVWEGMDRDSVTINVTYTWTRPDEYGAGPEWSCAANWVVHGFSPVDPATTTACRLRVGDRALEVQGQVQGHSIGVGPPWPQCLVNPDCGPPERWSDTVSTETAEEHYDDFYGFLLDRHDRPILHFTAWVGGLRPDVVRVEAEWTDTVMAVASGGFDDIFTYRREDFTSLAYARADTMWCECSYQVDAELVTTLVGPGRSAFFWFSPLASDGADWGAESPTGPAENYPGVTNVTGPWRFWFERGPSGEADVPILWGTQFDWAVLPWQE